MSLLRKVRSAWVERLGHATAEAVVVSYPKAGSTWLRFILGTYVRRLRTGGDEGPLPLFDDYAWWGGCRRWHPRVPLLRFTHGALSWEGQTADDLTGDLLLGPFRSKRVAFLVRSIPDVLVSLHAQFTTRDMRFEGTADDFVFHPVYGVEKAIRYYNVWHERRGEVRDFLLLRYEEMRADPAASFRAFLEYLGVPVEPAHVEAAVEAGRFERMRRLEIEEKSRPRLRYGSSGNPIFASGDIERDPQAFHVRRGKIGGYKDSLSPEVAARLERRLNEALSEAYGYRYP